MFYKLVDGKKIEICTLTNMPPNTSYHMWWACQEAGTKTEMFMLPFGNVIDIDDIEINGKSGSEVINKVSHYGNEYKYTTNNLIWEDHEREAQEWGGHLTSILNFCCAFLF